MIGAAAFFVLLLTLIVGGLLGIFFTISSTILLLKKKQKGAFLAWLIGGVPSLIGWIIFINVAFGTSTGGAPTAEAYKTMFKAFAFAGLTPGVMLTAGGISQLVWFFLAKRNDKKTIL